MNDWFRDLRAEKQQAISRVKDETAEQEAQQRAAHEQLLANHARILSAVEAVPVEPLLLQFFEAALRDHPLYSNASLVRSITGRTADAELAREEPAPWTGPLNENTRLQTHPLPDGHYVALIVWRLRFEARDPAGESHGPFNIVTSLNAQELAVDGQALSALTGEALAEALKQAFRNPHRVHADTGATHTHKRRHHQRPWYSRVLRLFSR